VNLLALLCARDILLEEVSALVEIQSIFIEAKLLRGRNIMQKERKNYMKYTVELTENGINETLELNGITYRKEWTRLENGLLECSQKDFSEQMRENGHDGDLIERVAEVFDSFLAGDVDDIRDCSD
jgi:hypothetical protein